MLRRTQPTNEIGNYFMNVCFILKFLSKLIEVQKTLDKASLCQEGDMRENEVSVYDW